MINKYEITYSGDVLATTNSYSKAIYYANNVLNIVHNNPIEGEDYTLLQIHKFSILDRILNYFNKKFNKKNIFYIPNYRIIVWSEKNKEFQMLNKLK